MKAWFATRYGPPSVLELQDAPDPSPKPGEVAVRVAAVTVNSGDVRVRGCDFPPGMKTLGRLALGWNGPRKPILGTEFAGTVSSVGEGVTAFKPGDAVFGFAGMRQTCHAEIVVMPANAAIFALPSGLDMHQAAAMSFGGSTALHYLRKAEAQVGQTMLVLGGSSCVGVALIQLAKARGLRVDATTSLRNIDLVRGLGAETVIDYTTTDPTVAGKRYDIVADAVGASSFADAQALLNPNGRYLAIAGAMAEMFGSLRKGANNTRMIAGPSDERASDIAELAQLAAEGRYRPHVDRVFAFADMPAAHAYVESKRKRGSLVVTVPV